MAEYKVVDAEKLDADLATVADAIRTKGNTTESLEFPNGFVDAVNAIESGGGTEEIENIIDASGVLDSTDGTATEKVEQLIDKAEDGNIWYLWTKNSMASLPTDFRKLPISKLPRMDCSKLKSLSYAFSGMPLVRCEHYINSDVCTNGQSVFQACESLEYVKGINVSQMTYAHDMFVRCSLLKTIEEPLDFSSISPSKTTNNRPFSSCSALEDVRFVNGSIKMNFMIQQSPLLSAESIQSIIDGLATVETAQTLTLHEDVKAKLTQTQLDTITSKNWNLA